MNRMQRLTIYMITLGVFLTATSELVVSGILRVLADDFSISIALAGQLVTAYSLAFAIGTPILVSLTSRLERRQVLLGALALYVLGTALSIAATSFAILLLARVVLGVSSGVYLVAAFGIASKIVPAEKVGGAIGTIILGFSSSLILGVPIGIAITEWLGWQAIFALLGAGALVVAVIIARMLPAIAGDEAIPLRKQWKSLGSVLVLAGLLFSFLREAGNSVLLTFLTPFMTDIWKLDASRIALIMLLLGVVGAAGSRLGGYGVDRWGEKRVIVASVTTHVAALALLPLAAGSYLTGIGLIALVMLAMFVSGPAIQTYFIRQSKDSANIVISLNTSFIHLGLAAGAGLGGVMAEETSTLLYHPWGAGVVVALGLAVLLLGYASNKRRSSLADIRGGTEPGITGKNHA
ncbi:MAG: major facilitator superfamily 1 [Paenibacillus sp.]|nr:major facilitator superfamily 1 [Paenibacillus sp.]